MKSCLVVAAHPDDEVLGGGGFIARMAAEGWRVHVLIMAEGSASRYAASAMESSLDERQQLRNAAHSAAAALGTTSVDFAGFPDNRMDSIDLLDVVKRISASIEQIKPVRVLTHNYGDVNIDHSITHQAVAAACRPLPGFCVREVYYFETPSSTEWRTPHSLGTFQPNFFVDISTTLSRKLQALHCYESEMRQFPHPRSHEAIEYLARWRGAGAGVDAAEAFVVGRIIE